MRFYSLTEAKRKLGTGANPQLIRYLIDTHAIPLVKVGNVLAIDQDGFKRLSEHFAAWKNRPRVSGKRAKIEAPCQP